MTAVTVLVAVLLQIASFTVLYIILTRRIRKELSTDQILDEIRDEVNSLVIELNQLTDRNVGIIEERIRRLHALTSESDKKIQLLSREIEKHQVGVDVYEKLKESSRRRVVESVSDNVSTMQPQNDDKPRAPDISPKPASLAVPEPASESINDNVIRLSHQGFDSRIIAKKLNSTVGEVELILSLHGETDGREHE